MADVLVTFELTNHLTEKLVLLDGRVTRNVHPPAEIQAEDGQGIFTGIVQHDEGAFNLAYAPEGDETRIINFALKMSSDGQLSDDVTSPDDVDVTLTIGQPPPAATPYTVKIDVNS